MKKIEKRRAVSFGGKVVDTFSIKGDNTIP